MLPKEPRRKLNKEVAKDLASKCDLSANFIMKLQVLYLLAVRANLFDRIIDASMLEAFDSLEYYTPKFNRLRESLRENLKHRPVCAITKKECDYLINNVLSYDQILKYDLDYNEEE